MKTYIEGHSQLYLPHCTHKSDKKVNQSHVLWLQMLETWGNRCHPAALIKSIRTSALQPLHQHVSVWTDVLHDGMTLMCISQKKKCSRLLLSALWAMFWRLAQDICNCTSGLRVIAVAETTNNIFTMLDYRASWTTQGLISSVELNWMMFLQSDLYLQSRNEEVL